MSGLKAVFYQDLIFPASQAVGVFESLVYLHFSLQITGNQSFPSYNKLTAYIYAVQCAIGDISHVWLS